MCKWLCNRPKKRGPGIINSLPNKEPKRDITMPRFSLIFICYVVTGFAGYFALFAAAIRNDPSFISWLANSLGLLYGTLLYTSGLSAFYVACRSVQRSTRPTEVAAAIPFMFLPALIGAIGVVHGYIGLYRVLSYSGASPNPSEMFQAHSVVLVCLLVGLCFTFVSFAILSIAMIVKSRTLAIPATSENRG
jgi:hypothetical protein